MGIFCVIMYAMAAAHWVLTLRRTLNFFQKIVALDSEANSFIQEAIIGNYTVNFDDGLLSAIVPAQSISCAAAPLLTVNIICSNIIVLWRAYCFWPRKHISLRIISGLLVLSTLGMSCVSSYKDCHSHQKEVGLGTGAFTLNVFGDATIILTWVTNIWANSLVLIKMWQQRKSVAKDLYQGEMVTKTTKILVLVIELGVLYCILWSAMVVIVILDKWTDGYFATTKLGTTQWNLANIIKSGLIHLIGMYPTVLLIIVTLTQSYCERGTGHKTSIYLPSRVSLRRPDPSLIVDDDIEGNRDRHNWEIIPSVQFNTVPGHVLSATEKN
ncbi:hypothetical protein PHLGIDRAFT_358654 [Phlebiopsis gigantea 11061_1 CR5-6]|uniref:G-protein coupled receptors family 1 profile domain-containing protein n=1 Tax=Phlebiopsis gigantea (strain 11061_1 CR5-6) TaxID=745531 RepID=A0A0C3NUA3_PHLG1|nr:hypothetical protein PHLGIDRAFT_358654 [Phlebiopsis gigantea 11061_1 CR5-6]